MFILMKYFRFTNSLIERVLVVISVAIFLLNERKGIALGLLAIHD